MKLFATLLSLALTLEGFTQCDVVGNYRDNFGGRLQLNADNTFKFTWHFDLASSWTNGNWLAKGDTIYLKIVLTYDTLRMSKQDGKVNDTLILSSNNIPERLSPEQAAATFLSSDGQNQVEPPTRLVYQQGRLYKIVNGKLLTKKQRGNWSWIEYDPWFFKTDD